MRIRLPILCLLFSFFFLGCSGDREASIQSGSLTLSFNDSLFTKIDFDDAKEPLLTGFQPSEILRTDSRTIKNFTFESYDLQSFENDIGSGRQLTVTGLTESNGYKIEKKITATVYDDIPDFISTKVVYSNRDDEPVIVSGWINNNYTLQPLTSDDHEEKFWSFQSGSYPSRPDWVLPVGDNFQQQNFMGMNASDYGGGTPVADLWRPDAGLAVGHTELLPRLISLPVNSEDVTNGASLAVQFDVESVSKNKFQRVIDPGGSLSTFETFVHGHTGDYYSSLKTYRKVLNAKGMEFSEPPETAYEPVWCAWGYGRDFTLQKVLNTIPKVKELGFDWVVLDDGWQRAEGDWRANEKFDDMSMKDFVDQVHDYGLKAKLWWVPLAADPGSRTHENNPEMLLVNKQGEYQDISWWDSHYLDPALEETQDYHTDLIKKFMNEWGFDGFKIDGQHLNQVPPGYGRKGKGAYPEESVEQLPAFYKAIYSTARDIKSDAVIEICPCGTSASSFIMPYMNQSVASDPLSSWQIRLKGKTFKALMGGNAAYYGDHVELSDNQNDFASTVGIGGVIGTKFTWPKSSSESDNRHLLTDEKETLVKKWMDIYKKLMLPKGTYRGELYDIGFDRPEAHVVEKEGSLFYAFYADSFEGTLQLRGLARNTQYQLVNYETGDSLGTVNGSEGQLKTKFTDHLMVEAKPVR